MLVPQVTDLVEYRDYDAHGHLIAAHHADGGVDRYRYNAFGDKIAWTDARGATTAYTYDKLGRLIQTASSSAIATYAIQNGALAATGAKPLIERIGYDELGRTLSTTNGAGETTYYRYDLRGNVTGVRKPGLSVELRSVYDARDRKIFEADGNGQAASWRYDYFGQLLAHTDLGGAVYTYSYDHAGQRLRQHNTRGQNLHYHYDAAGQLIRLYSSIAGDRFGRSYRLRRCAMRGQAQPSSSEQRRPAARYWVSHRGRNRGMARFGVVSAIAAYDIKPFAGRNLVEQFCQDIAIGNVPDWCSRPGR